MMRTFFLICAFIALSSPAFAGKLKCDDCKVVRHGVHRQVIPTDDYVCFWFVQPKKQNVLLVLHLRNGIVRRYTKKDAKMRDHICPGRGIVRQMTTASYICDELTAHFDYGQPEMIETLATKPKYSRKVEACLYGKKLCRAMGYPAYD